MKIKTTIKKSESRSESNEKPIKVRAFYNDRFHLKEASSQLEVPPLNKSSGPSPKTSKIKLPHLNKPTSSVASDQETLLLSESEDSVQDLLKRLKSLYNSKGISEENFETFEGCVLKLPRQKGANIVRHEMKAIKDNTCPTLLVMKAIKNREESLNSIYELNAHLQSTDWLSLKEVHLQCAELLHGHRLFTLTVVENITKWREELTNSLIINNLSTQFLEFKYQKENYLIKMRNDLDFLKTSQFSKILSFSDNCDPLLVSPSIPLGKQERGRKRDPNYFIDDGQVIVPIPTFIITRVRDAEDKILREYEYLKFLEENTPKKQAEMFGPLILESLIEEIVGKTVKELGIEIDSQKNKLFEDMRKEKEKEDAANKILDAMMKKFIQDELKSIAQEQMKMMKKSAKEIMNEQIAGDLSQQILEQLLKDADLFNLCLGEFNDLKAMKESEDREFKSQKDKLNMKLSNEIFAGCLDSFFDEILRGIALETLKDIRKEREEESSLYAIKSPLMEEIGLDFASMEYFSDLTEMKWVPLKLPEELIIDIMNEYYSVSPDINHTILPNIEDLMIEASKYTDTCWYWALKGTLILGFLVFSIDCFNKTGRKLIVHHISSLFWNKFSSILESATQHIWSIDNCDEIRINLFTAKGSDLTPEVKRIFTHLGYKWKTKYPVKESDNEITVLGKSKNEKSNIPAFMAFKLMCSEFISTSTTTRKNDNTQPQMALVGNRQNMLHALLGVFGKIENSKLKLSEKSQTTLQGVITSLLTLMNETQCFSFPYMASSGNNEQLSSFLSRYNIDVPSVTGKASASVLDLKFRWISCTNLIQEIRGVQYKFMRFKSKDIRCTRLNDEIETYYVPTELPNISAFFIRAPDIFSNVLKEINVNRKHLDMYSFAEKILQKEGLEEVKEIWVPSFNINTKWQVPWIEGYEIPAQQENEKTVFVDKCYEDVKLEMSSQKAPDGLLVIKNKFGPVLANDFIFGLMYIKGDKILDIPLFTCLVREEDWIKAI